MRLGCSREQQFEGQNSRGGNAGAVADVPGRDNLRACPPPRQTVSAWHWDSPWAAPREPLPGSLCTGYTSHQSLHHHHHLPTALRGGWWPAPSCPGTGGLGCVTAPGAESLSLRPCPKGFYSDWREQRTRRWGAVRRSPEPPGVASEGPGKSFHVSYGEEGAT